MGFVAILHSRALVLVPAAAMDGTPSVATLRPPLLLLMVVILFTYKGKLYAL